MTMKGPFSMVRGTSTGSGVAKRAGVGLVQLSHDPVGHPPGVLHQLEELVLVPLLCDGPQRRAEKQVDLAVGVIQHPGVVRVGRHAPQAEQHEGLQALASGSGSCHSFCIS